MVVDRQVALKAFQTYVMGYNQKDEMVQTKIMHTYRVCAYCDEIATHLGLSKEEIDLVWLSALLHDIGRFEQIKKFHTFNDSVSMDHAKASERYVFGQGNIINFVGEENYKSMEDKLIAVKDAILFHSSYVLPRYMQGQTLLFSKILRDADKLDILYIIHSLSDIDKTTKNVDAMHNKEGISEAVMEDIRKKRAVNRKNRQYPLDYHIGHISLILELEFPISYQLLQRDIPLESLFDVAIEHEATKKQLDEVRNHIYEHVKQKQKES